MPTSDRSALVTLCVSTVSVLVPVTRRLRPPFMEALRAALADRYARAGWPGGLDDDQVLAASLLAGVVVALPATLLAAMVEPVAAPAAAALILAGPGLASAYLACRARRRLRSISRAMPFVLDLLVLTMRAGASLSAAVERVAGDHGRHPIGAEFGALLHDMEHGATMREALEGLAGRVPVDEVRAFADELLQAEALGRPLADALERQAAESRERRLRRAVDVAGRAKVKVLIPGTLILVACLVVLFAPFIVRYLHGGFAGG